MVYHAVTMAIDLLLPDTHVCVCCNGTLYEQLHGVYHRIYKISIDIYKPQNTKSYDA